MSKVDMAETNHCRSLRFNLATLLLAMTFLSALLGLFVSVPVWGAFSLLVLLPALHRTVAAVNVRNASQGQTGIGEKLRLFYISLVIMLAAWAVFLFASLLGFKLTFMGAQLFDSWSSFPWWDISVAVLFILVNILNVLAWSKIILYCLKVGWPQCESLPRQICEATGPIRW